MKTTHYQHITFLLLSILFFSSCIDKDMYNKNDSGDNGNVNYVGYLYPYNEEVQNVTAEIMLETNEGIDLNGINITIPFLKYNKSWLFLLTQDDCKHAAYSTTWAAINGKPLSKNYYYNAEQLAANDLPPDVFYLNKTLGSTDGAGNEVRFAFTTTLAPEWPWMDAVTDIHKGYTKDYYRFYMKSGLTWNNLYEMLAYGTGIAFHDVNTATANLEDSILKHYNLSQQIILDKLKGRGCKMLAEPNGNKTYIQAAMNYTPIQIMTAQNSASAGPKVEKLYPFKVNGDLSKVLLQRVFYNSSYEIVSQIQSQINLPKEQREAIHAGVHGTDATFAEFLLWLNNTYGKDGDDSVWVPSLEEYYEYNYYRTHATIKKIIDGNKLKLTISLPSELYFYYPSITINLIGLHQEQIRSINSNDAITGVSYSNFGDACMINIDCRKAINNMAEHFVEKQKNNPTSSNKADAQYFVRMLKESSLKTSLLKQINDNK